jgi:hypothetical protein
MGIASLFVATACSMTTTALKEEGVYPSPKKICTTVLKRSPQGGFLQLFIQTRTDKRVHMADDVTGFL